MSEKVQNERYHAEIRMSCIDMATRVVGAYPQEDILEVASRIYNFVKNG